MWVWIRGSVALGFGRGYGLKGVRDAKKGVSYDRRGRAEADECYYGQLSRLGHATLEL
jgi:hypothetical protein